MPIVEASNCPHCGKVVKSFDGMNKDQKKNYIGAFALCGSCGEISKIGKDLDLALLDDFDEKELENQLVLLNAQSFLKEKLKNKEEVTTDEMEKFYEMNRAFASAEKYFAIRTGAKLKHTNHNLNDSQFNKIVARAVESIVKLVEKEDGGVNDPLSVAESVFEVLLANYVVMATDPDAAMEEIEAAFKNLLENSLPRTISMIKDVNEKSGKMSN